MSDNQQKQVTVEVTMENGQVQFGQSLMVAMWEQTRLVPYPVQDLYEFAYKGQRLGIVDLLCRLDELTPELRDAGPEQIIETILELINSVYIGDESTMLIGRCMDLYAIELQGSNCIVFRTIIMDTNKSVEEMLAIRELGQTLFPVPQPE
ncbi:hypothetical protein [Tumebacillus permanentifrigoris]|uniref:Uncharacterized protein n=1 Tax=Tumebacillus permanentifrigoris TaxID=378543 RepID=A0A316D8K0_9BACL|nr:hypothetical protein [Tumebacillus permanentifrigoris]PWK10258.1 hypothetical protein C7459_11279 [Tumebacillus permanentifrigoris]